MLNLKKLLDDFLCSLNLHIYEDVKLLNFHTNRQETHTICSNCGQEK